MHSLVKPSNQADFNYIEYRAKLYYDRFQYKINIDSPGIRLFRNLNITLKQYKIAMLRTYYHMPERLEQAETTYNLHRTLFLELENLKQKLGKDLMIRREWDSIRIFVNDLEIVRSYTVSGNCSIKTYKINQFSDVDVMYFIKPPKYRYRAYLGGDSETTTIDQLKSFVEKYCDQIKLNSGFKRLISRRPKVFYYSSNLNSCSFDFDDQRLLTILNLTIGNSIKKVYELRQLSE